MIGPSGPIMYFCTKKVKCHKNQLMYMFCSKKFILQSMTKKIISFVFSVGVIELLHH